LGCTYCCIEKFVVCGEEIDCNPVFTNIIFIVAGSIMLVFLVILVWCLVVHFCIGTRARKEFAYKVIEKDEEIREHEKRVGVTDNYLLMIMLYR
jgi:succinate dehydrogenase/fumarate reductase cytochrome b subunit